MSTTYTLRYMTLDDIPQVIEIDKLSFALPWSARSYTFEINDNPNAHMIVIEYEQVSRFGGGLLGLLRRLGAKVTVGQIIGYGGFWLIDGEIHISTIAIHPQFRGKGLGEVLLAGMLHRAIELNGEYAVLEVRVSNTTAINLYKKYGFEIVGKRKNYYRDNYEDANLMHLNSMNEAYQVTFNEHLQRIKARIPYREQMVRRVVQSSPSV